MIFHCQLQLVLNNLAAIGLDFVHSTFSISPQLDQFSMCRETCKKTRYRNYCNVIVVTLE